MKPDREMLSKRRRESAEKARSLRSYLEVLTETAARHGTDGALIQQDLIKAKNDAEFYEEQAARCGESLAALDDDVTYWAYQDEAGEWRWNLRASNGRIVADSGEGYRHKHDCLHGIELVKGSVNAAVRE